MQGGCTWNGPLEVGLLSSSHWPLLTVNVVNHQEFPYGECQSFPSELPTSSLVDVAHCATGTRHGTAMSGSCALTEAPAFPTRTRSAQSCGVCFQGPCGGPSRGSVEELLAWVWSDGLSPQVGSQAAMIIALVFIKH